MQCPMCLRDARMLGAIALLTPGQVADTSDVPPVVGYACVDCEALVAMLLDSLKGGAILQLAEHMMADGALRRR